MTQGMFIFKFSSWAFMMIINNKKIKNEITIGKCIGLPVNIVAAALVLSCISFFTEKLKFFLRPYLLFNR